MDYAFPPAEIVCLPAMSSRPFPIRRIYCVGNNFGAPQGDVPTFFCKPADAVLPNGTPLSYPPQTADLQAGVAMAVALNLGGRNIPADQANDYIFGYAVTLDMTRADVLAEGRPWDLAKGFDGALPCSALTPEFYTGIIAKGSFGLKVNGEVKQQADLGEMLKSVPELIAALSQQVELKEGDMILAGSPGSVSVARGDALEAWVAGLEPLLVSVK